MHDNAEYHVTRNGVDQDAIYGLFRELGFDCSIVRYFRTSEPLLPTPRSCIGREEYVCCNCATQNEYEIEAA